ncbi:TPA: hypothetical protein QDZ10_003641 [Stenotrophomonas maltophilia]|jgi:hypothetical protein|uniref:hypothetical protein n=1 Tax=Stenotrophomonas sp. PS02300 TaxID=2991426 RepID=UPI00249C38F8|nr:hypothetical protein [Stenotrophomonas sp. PS02300]HDS0925138.1 hypothetical protein [Stenotrophomonas maltophilia]
MHAALATDVLQPLHDALDELSRAVEGEDHDLTQRLMDAYDQQVRAYLDEHDARIDAGSLRGLIARQQQVSIRMAARRDEAGTHITADRRAVRASLAYLRAESLT